MEKEKIERKRARLTDDSLNCYGTRVLTDGMDISQYERNPVLLWMHNRGTVIGTVEDIRHEGGALTGVPVFDGCTELSRQLEEQWAKGSIRMVSVGIDILEMSEDPSLLVQGQTRPTVTRSKLFEVSIVDIGGNDNAIVLRREGKEITLGSGGANPIPLLATIKEKEMKTKELALAMGLAETATEEEITARATELSASEAECKRLSGEIDGLRLSAVTEAVDCAVREGRITEADRDHFIGLGKLAGIDSLKTTIAAMNPRTRLSAAVMSGHVAGGYKKLGEVPEEERIRLRREDKAEYERLYRAEYGMDSGLE